MTSWHKQTQKSTRRRWHGVLLCSGDWTNRLKPPAANSAPVTLITRRGRISFVPPPAPLSLPFNSYGPSLQAASCPGSLGRVYAAATPIVYFARSTLLTFKGNNSRAWKPWSWAQKNLGLGPVRFWLKTAVSVPVSITVTTLILINLVINW